MAWMIGIDEAGYGPNLGPLCVGATVWWVEENVEGGRGKAEGGRGMAEGGNVLLAPPATSVAPPVDLYTRLAHLVTQRPDDQRIAIADSKQLYKPGHGLRHLERGVLTARAVVDGDVAARWELLLRLTCADRDRHRHALPWYADCDYDLPIDADTEEIRALAKQFDNGCRDAGVQLVDVQARLVFPRQFNELTEYHGTKGAALSHVSIGLLREIVGRLAEYVMGDSTWPSTLTGSAHVTCDKHGGRNRYGALLQHHFPDDWIETIHESRAASRYQWGTPDRRIEVCFRTKGETELPTALASMTAKYQRELAMRAFNHFWCSRVSGLRPTAGYPVDAKRFKADIADAQQRLGIDDRDLWRSR